MPTGIIRENQELIAIIQKFFDIAIIFFCFSGMGFLFNKEPDTLDFLILGTVVLGYSTVAHIFQIYHSYRTRSIKDEIVEISKVVIIVYFFSLIGLIITGKFSDLSRPVIPSIGISIFLFISLQRIMIRGILRISRASGRNKKRVAIIGSEEIAQSLYDKFTTHTWMGIQVIGLFDDKKSNREKSHHLGYIIGGTFDDALNLAKAAQIDEIYIALSMRAEPRIKALLNKLSDSSVTIHLAPDIYTYSLLQSRMSHVGGMPVISLRDTPHRSLDSFIKRAEDLLLASAILIVISLPMFIIALIIKYDSKGPVLFKQKRYGLGGEKIEVWKFRSMHTMDNGATVKQATKNDPRITKVGAFLRRTSLDELPQFLNVLQGSMSVVGPRPHAVAHNELYRKDIDFYMQRHIVKPGITGWAQVNGWRGETEQLYKMQQRVNFDLEYIDQWSLWMDIKIVFLTIFGKKTRLSAY